MIIGFTGTRAGMLMKQHRQLEKLFKHFRPLGFNHGDAIGADAQAHDLALTYVGGDDITIYPCTKNDQRAFCQGTMNIKPVKDPLLRNRDIVDASDLMIATPATLYELPRGSGTWACIRYAKKVRKPLIIIQPFGVLEAFNVPHAPST